MYHRNEGIHSWLANRGKKKSSETKGNNQGRPPRIVVYCPMCSEEHWKRPMITTTSRAVKASCKNGHVFPIGGKSRPSS